MIAQIEGLPVVWSQASGGQWLRPKDVLFPDEACRSEPGLADLLIKDGCPICPEVPPGVAEQILLHTPGARQLTPAQARAHLRSSQEHPVLFGSGIEERAEVWQHSACVLWHFNTASCQAAQALQASLHGRDCA